MKTQKELNELKKEYETLNEKLQELSYEELRLVIGGLSFQKTGPNSTCSYHCFKKNVEDTNEICATCIHFKSPDKCYYVGPR